MGEEKLLAEWFWTDRWMGSSAFVLPMEVRGLYREMLTQAWRRGARLPADHEQIRRAIGATTSEWRRCWPKVERFWKRDGDSLVNETQIEIYREAQKKHREASDRGKKGAAGRWQQKPKQSARTPQAHAQADAQASTQAPAQAGAPALPDQQLGQWPPSPSPSPTPENKSTPAQGAGGTRPPLRALITSPLDHYLDEQRDHRDHVQELCGRGVCLPRRVQREFVDRLVMAGRVTRADAPEAVIEWAGEVIDRWKREGGVPGDDIFEFWRNEWKATHGTNRPQAGPPDALAGVREALRRG